MACNHDRFQASVNVHRMKDSNEEFRADIQVHCSVCGERFTFLGVPRTVSEYTPFIDTAGTVLHAPIRPAGAKLFNVEEE